MREFYLRYRTPAPAEIIEDIATRFDITRKCIKKRSHLVWAEHCSECAMPACFSYCEYYSPRMDLKCQRFEDGLLPVTSPNGEIKDSFAVTFKKWGKLEAPGIAKLTKPSPYISMANIGEVLENSLRWVPVPYFMQLWTAKAFNKIQKYTARRGSNISKVSSDTQFLIETYNPGEEASVTFTIREEAEPTRFFQKLITFPAGYNRTFIDLSEMANISLDKECLYQIEPSSSGKRLEIIFGILDFVTLTGEITDETSQIEDKQVSGGKKVKCVIWDLDNTMWDGTLIEDGIDGIKLRPEMVTVITKLDSMGILNAVASKNNHDDAMEAIKRFGLEDYFLYPQISWNPKSSSIKAIQQSLNIGMDTLVFIDDQIFERTEVSETLPDVRVFTDQQVSEMMELPEFNVPVTTESKRRRKMYQEDMVRSHAMTSSGEDYLEFLRSCNIELLLEPLSNSSMNRVHELSQRTNQMNFSGNRYTKAQLADIANDPTKRTFVISCQDRFGSYGIVGFAIVDEPTTTLIDLMFSCRIQAKQVEHTFFDHQFNIYKQLGRTAFYANYKPTKKNAQSGKVFFDVGFTVISEEDGVQKLSYDLADYQSKPPIMTVTYNDQNEDLRASA